VPVILPAHCHPDSVIRESIIEEYQTNKTKMILRQVGSNQTELSLNNGTTLFFSYETPVAGFSPVLGHFKTETYYSRTTSKHINQYFKHVDKVNIVTDDVIVSMCHPEGV
jgi:hypothetical protein